MARKDSITKLRGVLIHRRDALRKVLAGDLSMLKTLRESTSGDVVDAALDSVQDELNSQLAEVESRELAQIENALEQIRAGSYGACEGCNNNIPMARLQALPYATLCIECQQEVEKAGIDVNNPVDWARLFETRSADSELTINDVELDV